MQCEVRPKRSALARDFREQPEHRENQWFSLQIIGFGIARDAAYLFPHLRQPCKARKICIGLARVRAQLLDHPAFEAVDKGRKSHAIAAAERVALAAFVDSLER